MSVTSRISYQRNAAAQPAANLYGPMGAAAIAGTTGGPAPGPTSGAAASGAGPVGGSGGPSASFGQIAIGLLMLVGIWWAITWILERLLPIKDTPEFFRDWLHGLKIALVVAFWFILWKMSAGVAPFNMLEPYQTIALSV